MGLNVLRLQFFLTFVVGLHYAYGITNITADFTPRPVAVKGNSHSVMCSFTVGINETFNSVTLSRATELIVTLNNVNAIIWSSSALKQRATPFGSLSTSVLGVTFSNTLCDDEVSYKCDISVYNTGNIFLPVVSSSTTVSIEAPPQTPVQMTVSPNLQNIQEFTNVTFTCSGNVGKPAGTFQWYMFNGANPDNKTAQASTESPVSAGDCTFTRRSSLTIFLLRNLTGLVVRCRVYHPTQGNNTNPQDCTNPSAQFCQNSQTISVTYPVNVTVDSTIRQEMEGNLMTLTCKPEANPEAWLEWFKSDSNVTLSNSPQLTFTRLTLADSGEYICMGYNNISGVIFNASASVSVKVVPTTTPPPTTTTRTTTTKATTQSESSTGTTAPNKGDSTNIAAIVAPIVVGVVVIIVVVILIWYCCCKRKERSELEEPPEKPFNNNASINTKATQPDLVSNDKMYHISDSNILKSQDGLDYAEFYNQPRSRRPLTLDETGDYNSVSMPQV